MITLTALIIVLGLGWTVHKAWTLAAEALAPRPVAAKTGEATAAN